MIKKLLSISTLMLLVLMLNAQAPTWTVQNTGFVTASRGAVFVDAVSANIVWCVANDGVTPSNYIRELTRTTNGGTNWSPIVIPDTQIPTIYGISNVSAIDGNTAYISVFPTSSTKTAQGVYKTTNGGANWVNTSTGTFTNSSSFLNNVYFWDANNGVAQGDAWGTNNIFEIYTTTDGGTNWLKVPDANLPAGLSAEDGWTTAFLGETFNGIKYAWFGTNKGRIFRTTDGGFNWTVAASGFTDCAGTFAFTDENNGIALCNSGDPYAFLGYARTTNGGVSWFTLPGSGVILNNSICSVPGRLGWYIRTGATSPDLGSQISFDYGTSWTEIDNTDQHLAVSFVDKDNGWTGGFSVSSTEGGIFKFVPGSVGLDVNSIEKNELNVYPNPCTGKFSLINAENSLVNIYNAAGSLVYSGTVNNVKSFSIDLTNQAKGLYIIQVKDSNGVRTQKVSIN